MNIFKYYYYKYIKRYPMDVFKKDFWMFMLDSGWICGIIKKGNQGTIVPLTRESLKWN